MKLNQCNFHALYFVGIIPCIQNLHIRSEPLQPFLQFPTPCTHVDFSPAKQSLRMDIQLHPSDDLQSFSLVEMAYVLLPCV